MLASPEVVWLATAEEKQVHLSGVANITTDKVSHLSVGKTAATTVHVFPDKVPIGIDLSGRWVFVYLVRNDRREDFYWFLHRHAGLFSVLPAWTVRIVLPPPLALLKKRYEDDFRYALATRSSDLVKDVRWYFNQRRANELDGTPIEQGERYYELKDCLRATHFQVLYRRWLSEGETALEVLSSQATADAVERGAGDVKCDVLPFSYRHLSPLVDVARPRSKGAEKREETPARPRPLFESSPSLRNAIAEPVADATV